MMETTTINNNSSSSLLEEPCSLTEDARIDAIIDAGLARAKLAQQARAVALAEARAVDAMFAALADGIAAMHPPRDDAPSVAAGCWSQGPEPKPPAPDAWLRGALPVVVAAARNKPAPALVPVPVPAVAAADQQRPQSASVADASDRSYAAGVSSSKTTRPAPGAAAAAAAAAAAGATNDSSSSSGSKNPGPLKALAPGSLVAPSTTAATFKLPCPAAPADPATRQRLCEDDRLRRELAGVRQRAGDAPSTSGRPGKGGAATAATSASGVGGASELAGAPVLLGRVVAEKLPLLLAPAVRVLPPPQPDQAPSSSSSAAAAAAGATTKAAASAGWQVGPSRKPGGQKPGGRQQPAHGADFVEAPSRGQPSAMATLKPAPGVTLRAGAAVKRGPKPSPPQGDAGSASGGGRQELATRAAYRAAAKAAAARP